MTRFGWRNAAAPFLKAFANQGLSASEAMQSLRASGFKFRDSDFRAEYRDALGDQAKFRSFKFLNRNVAPSNDLFKPIKPTWDEAYSFTVRVAGQSIATGEKITRNLSFRSNERLTRDSLLERVREWFGEGITKETDKLEVNDILIVEGYRNARVTG